VELGGCEPTPAPNNDLFAVPIPFRRGARASVSRGRGACDTLATKSVLGVGEVRSLLSRPKVAVSPVGKIVSSTRATHEKVVARHTSSLKALCAGPPTSATPRSRKNFDMLDQTRERALRDIVDDKLPTHPRPERFVP
jgi:hypothetical protein